MASSIFSLSSPDVGGSSDQHCQRTSPTNTIVGSSQHLQALFDKRQFVCRRHRPHPSTRNTRLPADRSPRSISAFRPIPPACPYAMVRPLQGTHKRVVSCWGWIIVVVDEFFNSNSIFGVADHYSKTSHIGAALYQHRQKTLKKGPASDPAVSFL